MRGPRPQTSTFPAGFLQQARDTVRRRTASVQSVQRGRLALLLHEHSDIDNGSAAARSGLSARQVQRWRQRWARGDFSFEDRSGRGRKASFSPNGPSVGESDRL